MKVLFISNIPSPYRLEFFKELGKYCELDVVFERETSSERDESWGQYKFENYNGKILHGINTGKDKALTLGIIKYLKRDYDVIVVANPATPVGIISIMYLKSHKKKYYIEGDGAQYVKRNFIKESLKKAVIKGAYGYLSTSKSLDYYYMMYGAAKEKIYRYPFTSVSASEIQNIEELEEKKKKARLKMGIPSDVKMVLSIGRFDYIKGFDILIKSMKSIRSAQCYIIGGDVTDEYLAVMEHENIDNVVFSTFLTKDRLSDYYYAADIFVLPTRYDPWGLVINEAMAYGLPVISTDKCVAASELIEEGVNGYIVRAEDVDELAMRIHDLLDNTELMKKMQGRNLIKIKDYTIENMAARHMDILKK
jgi:glycosyltransferase involved in cell wall biosynthesis